ncbi:MAG TPA: hypothetical protein EYM31_08310 [Acidobacteria bacterium]|nr:hypothetical protein [Acidobacteriota bacterium]
MKQRVSIAPHLTRIAAMPVGELAIVVGIFAVLATASMHWVVRNITAALPSDLGDPLLNTWILAWDADRFRHGLDGFWDAPMFFPYPSALAYSEHLLGVAIFTAPLQWLTDNPIFVYNVAYLGSFVLAGTGMYLLTKSITGSRLAGVVGGMAFAFLPYRADQAPHLQVLLYGWMPISLWGLHRYFESGQRKMLVVFAFAFVLQGFSNGYFFYFFSAVVVIVASVELIYRVRQRPMMLVDLTCTALLMGAMVAPIAIAYIDVRADMSLVRSRSEMVMFSANATSYLHASQDLAVWGENLETLVGGRGGPETKLFPGFGLFVMAALGLIGPFTLRAQPPVNSKRIAITYSAVAIVGFLLSLGPEPAIGDLRLWTTGPYDWLLSLVPGFDGLRVPARAAIVVFLAFSVLASIGTRCIVDRISRRAALIIILVITTVSAAEGYHTRRMVPFHPNGPEAERATTEWLRQLPQGPTIILPFYDRRDRVPNIMRSVYATLQHGHPLVNGFSGFSTPLVRYFEDTAKLRDYQQYNDVLHGLRAIGVRYVVVHGHRFRNTQEVSMLVAAIQNEVEQLANSWFFGTNWIFELQPSDETHELPPTAHKQIDRSEFQVSASHDQRRLERAFDGDYRTRWTSDSPQAGHEWMELRFDQPTDVSHVRLWLRRADFNDYPRQLLIETTEDGEHWEELYQGRGFPRLLLSLVERLDYAHLDVPLPINKSQTLRLRQTRSDPVFYWSIHELHLWER